MKPPHLRLLSSLVLGLSLAVTLADAVSAAEKPLELSDPQGRRHAPLAPGGGKPVALIFVSPYCPSSNAFIPEVNRIVSKYGDRVAFYLVLSDPSVNAADAIKQAELYGVTATMLLDGDLRLARATKAGSTPEAALFDATGAVRYQGRINDLYLNRTRKQPEPKTHDLVAAIEAILAGRPVAVASTKAVGCSIPTPE